MDRKPLEDIMNQIVILLFHVNPCRLSEVQIVKYVRNISLSSEVREKLNGISHVLFPNAEEIGNILSKIL